MLATASGRQPAADSMRGPLPWPRLAACGDLAAVLAVLAVLVAVAVSLAALALGQW
jgi:hypothetical protein